MIDETFRRVAAGDPDRVAVRGWDGGLTYRELDERAGRLAVRLRRAGVRPGAVVGVHLDRSAAAVAGLLAILRLGAAYAALDPRQPAERTAALLRTAGVGVVLTGPGPVPAGCVAVDPADEPGPVVAPGPIGPEHVAYLAQTSGSTGGPKVVAVPHRAVLRLVRDGDHGPDDVFVQYAPLAFDASTLEVWTPLLTGGCLVVPPPGDPTPAALAGFVRRHGVTVLWLTAGLFHQVVETALDDLRGLRQLLAGGDVLSVPHVNRALAALPGTVLVNGYGPTENTTFTCCHRMTAPVAGRTVPIGRAVAGSTAYVLDDRLRPVGPGGTGELYTGGLGVAHGYAGDPALTAQRFLPDPFAPRPGARMYRTGDLVRRAGDGLEFLGRADRQVKVRGFRVELAEVESVLAALPGVAGAAVVARRDRFGDQRLAGFVTGPVSVVDVRRQLAARLPDHAVPASLVRLDDLPLTANGKLDRAGLEGRPVPARPELSTDHREPEGPVETAMTGLWADLLEVDGVGADDDFFELGGHSLLGVRVLGEVRRTYGVDVAPLAFYLDPTPAGLARAIASAPAEEVS